MKTYAKLSLLGILILALSQPAMALRCGNHIIQEGDPKLKVLLACGKPDLVNWAPYAKFGAEEWQYNHGASRFMTSIKFSNGEVIVIKDKGYGL